MRIAVFPGSFDPFTKGHESIVHKALQVFDEVIIAIGVNSKKTALFSLEKRKAHISSLFKERVIVCDYHGLTVDFCHNNKSKYIIRGLRDTKDFEYENSIAQMNKMMSDVETVFFTTEPLVSAINSSIVREIYLNNGDISSFVTNFEILV